MFKVVTGRNFVSTVIVALLIGWMINVRVANAQSNTNPLEYGQSVKGEITDANFTFTYTFNGKADDIVIINVTADPDVSYDKAFTEPEFKLIDPKKKTIIDTSKLIEIGSAFGVIQLARDGVYTISLTRRDGATGKGVGNFVLSLTQPTLLETDNAVKDTASSTLDKYYYVDPTGSFSVGYTKESGKFAPTVSIRAMTNNGDTSEVAQFGGTLMTSGSITIKPDDGVIYLVKVSSGLFEFSQGDVQYTITRTDIKS